MSPSLGETAKHKLLGVLTHQYVVYTSRLVNAFDEQVDPGQGEGFV